MKWRLVKGAASVQTTGDVIFLVFNLSLKGEIWLGREQRFLQTVCGFLQSKQMSLLM